MTAYRVTIMIDGAWGTRYKERVIYARGEDHAEEKAMEYLDTIETRYDENSWGAYEQASIEDIILIA